MTMTSLDYVRQVSFCSTNYFDDILLDNQFKVKLFKKSGLFEIKNLFNVGVEVRQMPGT